MKKTTILHEAARDIPLLHLPLAYYCTLLIAAYDPSIRQLHPLANAARTATEAMGELKNLLDQEIRAEEVSVRFKNQTVTGQEASYR